MTREEMADLVSAISYKPGWTFILADDGRPFLQSDLTMAPTGKTTERTPWKSGKRYLSTHMCRQEVVGSVFALIKDAEMHEIHEWFRFRGASIYNPHLDPDALVDLARKRSSFVWRENAMSMSEGATS